MNKKYCLVFLLVSFSRLHSVSFSFKKLVKTAVMSVLAVGSPAQAHRVQNFCNETISLQHVVRANITLTPPYDIQFFQQLSIPELALNVHAETKKEAARRLKHALMATCRTEYQCDSGALRCWQETSWINYFGAVWAVGSLTYAMSEWQKKKNLEMQRAFAVERKDEYTRKIEHAEQEFKTRIFLGLWTNFVLRLTLFCLQDV